MHLTNAFYKIIIILYNYIYILYVTGFWKTVPNHTTTEIHSIA